MGLCAASIAEGVIGSRPLGRPEAAALLEAAERDPWPVLAAADRVRRHFRGRRVHLCSIAPVKLGHCTEDCHWCAQSAHWPTGLERAGPASAHGLAEGAVAASACGAGHFGLVASGGRLADDEFAAVLDAGCAVRRAAGLQICASLGALTPERAARLRAAGFVRYNHNLETSARHFARVCTTHTWADRLRSARVALDAGLELCSGAIFGIGETDADRVDVAFALRDLGAHVVPLNFLHPIVGTPLADMAPLPPLKILSIVAMFRFVLPDRIIKLAGGREHNLRDLQALMFLAGADACLVGNYLTTRGRPAERDLRMIRDLGLEPDGFAPPPAGGPPDA